MSTLSEYTLKTAPVGTDELELQETDGGTSRKTTIDALAANLPAITATEANITGTLDVSGVITAASQMKIDPGMELGTYSATGATNGWLLRTNGLVDVSTTLTSSYAAYRFFNPNGQVGNIVTIGSVTQFNTSSDPELKSEFAEMDHALAAQMVKDAIENKWIGVFNFKAEPDEAVAGYNAWALIDNQPGFGGSERLGPRTQKIGSVYQEATYDEEGTELTPELRVSPAGVDQSKRVPLLEAALYNALKRIEALES